MEIFYAGIELHCSKINGLKMEIFYAGIYSCTVPKFIHLVDNDDDLSYRDLDTLLNNSIYCYIDNDDIFCRDLTELLQNSFTLLKIMVFFTWDILYSCTVIKFIPFK